MMRRSARKIELHRHLDVSLRASTLLELAQARGLVAQSTSLEAFKHNLYPTRPFPDLASALAQFTLFQKVLSRPEILRRIAREAVEDCASEGLDGVEFRFSPGFVCELHPAMSWDDALSAFELGIEDARKTAPQIQAGLICIASRDYGADSAAETVEFFLKHRKRFVGLDLAGNEKDFPCHMFESAFRRAKDSGANITIHAGEAAGPENMWEAIELLGAKRIGHGIRCIEDPKLMRMLAEKKICLEVCPSSNWLIGLVPSLKAHPLARILRENIPVTINTDDPGFFGVDWAKEVQIAREIIGLNPEEIERCFRASEAHTFLPHLSA
jgi:adenosine deaminase